MAYVDEKQVHVDQEGVGSWEIDILGKIGGAYKGLFKFRTVLSPIQLIEADRDYRELLGKNAEFAETHVENMAYTLTQLKHRILSAPPFWNDGSRFPGGHIRDDEIISAVYEAAVISEKKFRDLLTQKHKSSIERLKKVIEEQEATEKADLELAQMDEEASKPTKKAKKK